MFPRRDRECGITIVELLVVLAIIGLIASLSVPVMARMGLFGGQAMELGSRELFTMLKAAKIYATTYNVKTALAYSVRPFDDSVTGEKVPVMDGMILVRQLKRAEVDKHQGALGSEVYVPVRDREGRFALFPNRTCVLLDGEGVLDSSSDFKRLMALAPVKIYDPVNEAIMTPRLVEDPTDPDPPGYLEARLPGWKKDFFPAHVFLPSGEVETEPWNQKARVTLRVGLYPEADPDERFYVDPETEEFLSVDAELTLYTVLGRVKVET